MSEQGSAKASIRRLHCFVSGRVQGVFFRACTAKCAERLGLNGWVCNLSDGRVEAIFQGPNDALLTAATWLRTGSPQSRVESVDEEWSDLTEEITGFRIL